MGTIIWLPMVSESPGLSHKVTAAYIYALKGKNGTPNNRKPKQAALGGVEALVQAKRMADALGGVDKARELLAALAQLV